MDAIHQLGIAMPTQRYLMAAIHGNASPLNLHRLTFACYGGTTAEHCSREGFRRPMTYPDLPVATLSGKVSSDLGKLDVALTISAPDQPTEAHLARTTASSPLWEALT